MTTEPAAHFRWFLENGVALVEVLTPELNDPEYAREFGARLLGLLAYREADKYVLNFRKAKYIGSTAYAIVFDFARRARESGARVVVCGLNHDVMLGAHIVRLPEVVPIVEDEAAALDLLRAGDLTGGETTPPPPA